MENNVLGWIGLGNMGKPMAHQLITAGNKLFVYNRNSDKEKELLAGGAATSESPKELINKCSIVFIMISDDQAVKDVFMNENGLLAANENGKIIVNMSTVSPGVSHEMAEYCKKQGNDYLDAPVRGSVKQAEEAQLVIMVGGDQHIYEKVKPLFKQLSKISILLGKTGAGNTAKLAINTLLGIYALGLSESILFAESKGINAGQLMELLNNSALANTFGKIKGEAIINNQFKPAFALKHISKDLRLAVEEGLVTPLAQTAFQTFKNAELKYKEEDIIAVYKQLKEMSS